MRILEELFENNRRWSDKITAAKPDFFATLAKQQAPRYLWIGCADSRVPANEIVDLMPGELFVHRNVGNVVVHSDINCLSVLQFAVEILKVEHVMVVGHYGCGGVRAALLNLSLGLVDNWLRHIRDVYHRNQAAIEALPSEGEKVDRLCELNVIEQAVNVCQTTIVQGAWEKGQKLAVHAWIYGLKDGLLHDLNFSVTGPDEVPRIG